MKILEIEQVTLDYIREIFNKIYTGKIHVTKLDPVGYSIKLGLNTPELPVTIYAELEDEPFLKFLKEELKGRLYHLIYYGKLDLVTPYDCAPRKTSCACHDKG